MPLDQAVAVARTAVVVGVVVTAVVLGDPAVMMPVVGSHRDGCRPAPDHRRNRGQHRQFLYVHLEHLSSPLGLVGQVVKLLMACSIVGASASHWCGGAAPTITVVAERPATMQATSR